MKGFVKAASLVLAIFGAVSSPLALAGQDEVNAAKGVIMISYTVEKCTNREIPDDIIQKLAKLLRSQGATGDEVGQGFQQGMMQVELKYPRNTKPPKAECDKARYLYGEFLKAL